MLAMRHQPGSRSPRAGATRPYWPGGSVLVVPTAGGCPGIPGAVGTIGSRRGASCGMTGLPLLRQHRPFDSGRGTLAGGWLATRPEATN